MEIANGEFYTTFAEITASTVVVGMSLHHIRCNNLILIACLSVPAAVEVLGITQSPREVGCGVLLTFYGSSNGNKAGLQLFMIAHSLCRTFHDILCINF